VIPVAEPDIGELEEKYVSDAVRSGWVSSIGAYINKFEASFAEFCESTHGIAVSNGTDALIVSLKAAGVGPGDEVIVPALTFAAVPAAVKHVGGDVVIADVHPDYWNIDPEIVADAISPKTKAIIAVHSYGHPADMDPIMELANQAGIVVIEDCAEAHGARYKGKRVGSIGHLGTFSFYGNKVITTGEGGMVVTNDENFADRVRFLKDHAMDPKRRYYHTEIGYNQRMTNLQAALGCAQMERIDYLLAKRLQILDWYRQELTGVQGISTINPTMSWAEPVNWMTSVLFNDELAESRDKIMNDLREKGVDTRPLFVPMHRLPPYKDSVTFSKQKVQLIADNVGARGLNLPTSTSLAEDNVKFVSSALQDVLKNYIN